MSLTASTSPLFIPSLQTLLISCVCPLFPLPPPLLPVLFPEAARAAARKPSCTSPQDKTALSCLSVFSLGSPTGPFLEFLCPPCVHVHQYTHTWTHMHIHPHLQSPPHMLTSSHIDTTIYTCIHHIQTHTYIPNPQHKHPHMTYIHTSTHIDILYTPHTDTHKHTHPHLSSTHTCLYLRPSPLQTYSHILTHIYMHTSHTHIHTYTQNLLPYRHNHALTYPQKHQHTCTHRQTNEQKG